MRVYFVLFGLLIIASAQGQLLEESEIELKELETQLKKLELENRVLEMDKRKLENSPDKYSLLDYYSMPSVEFLEVAAKNYGLFKERKSSIVNLGSKYLIFLPKEKVFALGTYKERKRNNIIFYQETNELKLRRNSFDFYELNTVIYYLPKRSENLSVDYVNKQQDIEKELSAVKEEITITNEKIVDLKIKIETLRIEREELIASLVSKSKFKLETTIYSKSLNGDKTTIRKANFKNNDFCFSLDMYPSPCMTVEELSKEYFTESEFKYAFSKKYGASNYELIRTRRIRIGAPSIILLYIYGRPYDINTSTGSWGRHEQWVYRSYDTYVYVENGMITSWQD